ncbi:MAG: aminotransferase class I/II-fold pyridoxal phosphate-dependent enzyme [Ruminococcus sp.]
MKNQNRAPLVDALKKYQENRPAYFCIPGHRYERGMGQRWLSENECGFLKYDLTEADGLDDLHQPSGVIAEAQELLAELYGADKSYFLVNGTTCGNEAMLLGTLKEGDKILVPRNVHKSVLQGMILSGAKPVYLMPRWMETAGIAGGISPEEVRRALETDEDIRAVFLVSPSYYGVCSDIRSIAEICHAFGVPLLVDEAHGSHLYFSKRLPAGALELGADACAQSFHKTTAALTQSSVLHIKRERINVDRMEKALKLVQSTSPSYLLMASLDNSRYELAHRGREMAEKALDMAEDARRQIQKISHMRCLCEEDVKGRSETAGLDGTRLVFECENMSGYELQKLLRKKYQVETELSDARNVLAIVTFANDEEDIRKLVDALEDIGKEDRTGKTVTVNAAMPLPKPAVMSPREAYFAESRPVKWELAVGKTAAEMIAPYPPGIPLICPGECLTKEIYDVIETCRRQGCHFHGPGDESLTTFKVIEKEP